MSGQSVYRKSSHYQAQIIFSKKVSKIVKESFRFHVFYENRATGRTFLPAISQPADSESFTKILQNLSFQPRKPALLQCGSSPFAHQNLPFCKPSAETWKNRDTPTGWRSLPTASVFVIPETTRPQHSSGSLVRSDTSVDDKRGCFFAWMTNGCGCAKSQIFGYLFRYSEVLSYFWNLKQTRKFAQNANKRHSRQFRAVRTSIQQSTYQWTKTRLSIKTKSSKST